MSLYDIIKIFSEKTNSLISDTYFRFEFFLGNSWPYYFYLLFIWLTIFVASIYFLKKEFKNMNKLKIILSIAIFFISFILASINQIDYYAEISPQSYGQLCMYELKNQEIFSKLHCNMENFGDAHSMLFSSFVSLLYHIFKPNIIIQWITATTLYALTITILFLISNKFLKWYQALILTLIFVLNKFTLYHLSIPDKEPLSNFLLAITFYTLTHLLYKPNTKDIIMFGLILNALAESSATYTIITPIFIIALLLNQNNKKIRIKQLIILFFIFIIFAIPKAKVLAQTPLRIRNQNEIKFYIQQAFKEYYTNILNNSIFFMIIFIISFFGFIIFNFYLKQLLDNHFIKQRINIKKLINVTNMVAWFSFIVFAIIILAIIINPHAGREGINPHVLSRVALPTYLFIIFNLSALTIYSKINKKMMLKTFKNKKINIIQFIINIILILTLIENSIYAYQNDVFKVKDNIFISTQFALNDLAKFFDKTPPIKGANKYIIGLNGEDNLWISKIYYMPINRSYDINLVYVTCDPNDEIYQKIINHTLNQTKECKKDQIIILERDNDNQNIRVIESLWKSKNFTQTINNFKIDYPGAQFVKQFLINLHNCNNKIIKLYENQKYVIFLIPKKNETESKH